MQIDSRQCSLSDLLPKLQGEIQSRGVTVHKKKSKIVLSWTKEEDVLLQNAIQLYGINNWDLVDECVPGRTKKQCKDRYYNRFDPNIIRKPWSYEEDQILLKYRNVYGNKWTEIRKYLPGRTANQIKNRFFSHFADLVENQPTQQIQIHSVFIPVNSGFTVIVNSPIFY
ncbi:r2r3-MYB transcription factor, putative [Entamoeba dispar SAW760]|uniref:R2r3-MYB transcription factor, putative n=1 Tax=Entamoeba dispar (strain ATCC PRA-260 / SAW760) TaxID=370354 RepID=B0ETD3_ENTDS|nr:r2r3-MYB transcription factor, putative [Entamoeba dispar SAW760]EDR22118.1 r2r3-MYB transcription factor, putative [Entamoeba dispar SAW760]|eukprot:EDR22118.1 r2r3-MYB transcription factor, putative [Entamoeba dispar SAW760]